MGRNSLGAYKLRILQVFQPGFGFIGFIERDANASCELCMRSGRAMIVGGAGRRTDELTCRIERLRLTKQRFGELGDITGECGKPATQFCRGHI